jgi:hypothetical protein
MESSSASAFVSASGQLADREKDKVHVDRGSNEQYLFRILTIVLLKFVLNLVLDRYLREKLKISACLPIV